MWRKRSRQRKYVSLPPLIVLTALSGCAATGDSKPVAIPNACNLIPLRPQPTDAQKHKLAWEYLHAAPDALWPSLLADPYRQLWADVRACQHPSELRGLAAPGHGELG